MSVSDDETKYLFRFSTQIGSTSPSKTIQCRLSPSPLTLSIILRKTCVNNPSVHSRVVESRVPYRASFDITFGSITYETPSTPSNLPSASSKTLHAVDFPLPEAPTIITPWWML